MKPTKSYLHYFDISLLGQQVNFVGLITLEDKLRTIYLLIYLDILDVLELYLKLNNYFLELNILLYLANNTFSSFEDLFSR